MTSRPVKIRQAHPDAEPIQNELQMLSRSTASAISNNIRCCIVFYKRALECRTVQRDRSLFVDSLIHARLATHRSHVSFGSAVIRKKQLRCSQRKRAWILIIWRITLTTTATIWANREKPMLSTHQHE